MSRLRVEGLSFSYGARTVLENISFSAGAGELLCVLGANGAGKSTLFRCVLGLQNGYRGSICVDGAEVRSLPPAKAARKLAYIPQYHTPAFSYSVFHTVLMGTTPRLGMFASPGRKQEEEALRVLEQLGIASLRDRGCEEISGGERQLVSIARAVVQQAGILIMDEPTANLDYGNQIRVMEQISTLSRQGYTVILSTHNPEHALLYASRVLVLQDRMLLCDGPPERVMTEELLRRVYRADVRLETLWSGGREVRVCVPVPKE